MKISASLYLCLEEVIFDYAAVQLNSFILKTKHYHGYTHPCYDEQSNFNWFYIEHGQMISTLNQISSMKQCLKFKIKLH